MRGRGLDMMGIDESVALKAVNNGPLFYFVLFCFAELQKQESQIVGVILLSLLI